MRNIARLSDNDRRELFRNTADKMGLNDAIVEKDFWVCFTLDYLFHRSPWKESITFKGGTSLSKAFHLISRFSEDIDLILDWRVLGYGKDEPWEKRSNTKQDAFNKEANVRAEVFLSETFCPAVKAGLSQEIGCEANVYIDEKDKQTVIFAYPHLFTNTATLQVIRLEIGALAAWTPAKTALIEPYAAKYYPKIFEQKETAILTVAPERTFWEKATILHHEANRPEHLEMPQRYSRHYYDLYRMAATPVKEAAFSRLDLLKKVVDFKMKFYPRSWAKYPERRGALSARRQTDRHRLEGVAHGIRRICRGRGRGDPAPVSCVARRVGAAARRRTGSQGVPAIARFARFRHYVHSQRTGVSGGAAKRQLHLGRCLRQESHHLFADQSFRLTEVGGRSLEAERTEQEYGRHRYLRYETLRAVGGFHRFARRGGTVARRRPGQV